MRSLPPLPGRLARAAAAAIERGWFVFPVRPRSKIPAIMRWEQHATRDLDQIRRWWADDPRRNIGIACGPSNLLVVDIDQPDATAPADRYGEELLRERAASAGETWPPTTSAVRTPSGGRHWYFQAPPGLVLRNTQGDTGPRGLGPCIDTRGHGGYVLAAGSLDRHGRRYRTSAAHPVAELPSWLARTLTPPPPVPHAQQPGPDAAPVPQPRVRAYVRAVVDGEAAAVAAARVGHRHTTLLAAARRLGHWVGGGALTEDRARAALTAAAAHYIGVDGYTAAQVERDISDGLTYGARLPRYANDIPAASGRFPPSPGPRPGENGESVIR